MSGILRARLRSNTCTAAGQTGRGNTPIIGLCRALIAAGLDPGRPMEVYRGDVLSVRIRSIGEAARLEINGRGTGFKCAASVGTASPMRQTEMAPTTPWMEAAE